MIRVGAALLWFAACANDNGPQLSSVSPMKVPQGGLAALTGERLCGEDGDCDTAGGAIRIGYDNPVQAQILEYGDRDVKIRIPNITPIGETVLIATVNERASNALAIEVVGAL